MTHPDIAAALQQPIDLLIVGNGGGSMCAALAAKRLGQRAVILEKQAKVGGSTALSGGVWWIPANPLLARAGVSDSPELAQQYLDALVSDEGPATSRERQQMLLRTGPKMVAFLEELGMRFRWADGWSDYHDALPGGAPRGRSLMAEPFNAKELGPWRDKLATYTPFRHLPVNADEAVELGLFKRTWGGKKQLLKVIGRIIGSKLTGRDLVTNGAAIQGRMLQIALREQIPILPETAVSDLIVEGGRVVGVKATSQGREIEIRARSVLLNSGGFARNAEMRAQLQRLPASATNANVGDTGEVLQAAMRLGAATAGLQNAVWVTSSRSTDGTWPKGSYFDGQLYPPIHNFDLAKPHSIIVDQNGQRYVNEATSYVELGERMYNRAGGAGVPSWFILDARFVRWYGISTNPPGFIPKQWYESRYLRKAATLEELATDCGIDPAALRRTVERFNAFASTGVDDDFGRGGCQYDKWRGDPTHQPNPSLGPIDQGPFHAIALYPGDVGTSGGLVTDPFARVLREDGSCIPGLYAVGNCAASVFGASYPGAGASIASSFVFAYVAAHHASGRADLLPAAAAPVESRPRAAVVQH